MKKKWIRMIAAALTALMMVGSACAEGILTAFYDAGCRMLFETDNVTLSGSAKFSLDGEWFKTAEGTDIQAGDDAYQRLRLVTPLSDGTERVTGYTVFGKGSDICVIEDYTPQYYKEGERFIEHSVISNSVYLNSLLAMGRTVADALEQTLADKITAGQTENGGSRLEIKVGQEEIPAILDGIVTMIGEYLAEAYTGTSYKYHSVDFPEEGPNYTISDWSNLFAHIYEEDYGEAMPEDYYEILWTDEGDAEVRNLYLGRYDAVNMHIDELISNVLSEYKSGFIDILPDGTEKYYPRQDDYIIDHDQQYILYEDFMTTVRQRWEEVYGEALSEEEFDLIFDDGNEERLEEYFTLTNEMEEEYLAQIRAEGKAAAVWIHADGTAEPIEDLTEWYNRDQIRHAYTTVTEGIVYCMRALAVDGAEIFAETDGEGRLSSIEGTLNLKLTDNQKQDHALDVTFRFDAGKYGESQVEAFDPVAYGVVPWPIN